MNLSLIPIFTSVAAGVVSGVSLGFVLMARRQAIRGDEQHQENPFRWFFSRPLNDIFLFEFLSYFAIVMGGCLALIALAASPIWVTQWLGIPKGAVLPVSYALGALSFLIAYRVGRKLWLRQL